MRNTGTIYSSTERSPTVLPEMAELLSPLTGEQLAALETDILKNGCYSPVIVNEDMVVIDGHNRQRLCEQHGLPYQMAVFSFEDMLEAKQWALDTQKGRRYNQQITKAPHSRAGLLCDILAFLPLPQKNGILDYLGKLSVRHRWQIEIIFLTGFQIIDSVDVLGGRNLITGRGKVCHQRVPNAYMPMIRRERHSRRFEGSCVAKIYVVSFRCFPVKSPEGGVMVSMEVYVNRLVHGQFGSNHPFLIRDRVFYIGRSGEYDQGHHSH